MDSCQRDAIEDVGDTASLYYDRQERSRAKRSPQLNDTDIDVHVKVERVHQAVRVVNSAGLDARSWTWFDSELQKNASRADQAQEPFLVSSQFQLVLIAVVALTVLVAAVCVASRCSKRRSSRTQFHY